MSLFKRLKKHRCWHIYKLYGCSEESVGFGAGNVCIYHFVCLNCKNEIQINSLDLNEELLNEKLNIQKKEALAQASKDEGLINDLNNLNDKESLTMRISKNNLMRGYHGKYVDSIKMKYLQKGINLDEITKWEERDN